MTAITYSTKTDILQGIVDIVKECENQFGKDPAKWPKKDIQNSVQVKFLKRLLDLYFRYENRSKNYGYIGVGCISYAEYYLRRYQEKVNRMFRK